MALYDVSLTVSVTDPAALWRRAHSHLLDCGISSADAEETIGILGKPKVGACLAMLLDRSEHLDGAEIMQHEVEELED